MADDAASVRDYRDTVFLPQTSFPMRAGLPKLEPEILARWDEADLYKAIRADRQARGAPLFVLHDGPPYANGAIHIGHALDKTLKDFVVRSRFLLGFDVDYVPGWDCHGLPIEWQIEKEFKAKGRSKDEVPPAEFRSRCREYAAGWIDVQMAGFRRLGVLGDWANRYATMDFTSEATIVAEFHKFVTTGQVYRGSKPVMWSPVERTALAEAEVEYADHVSPTVWVKFPVTAGLDDAAVVIWTTTPWTIPANRAISFNPAITYGLYRIESLETDLAFGPWVKPGDRLVLADKLAEEVLKAAKAASWSRVETVDPAGLTCAHPLAALAPDADDKAGYGFAVPLLAGDHVTDDAGTGFVHTAPGHGAEDYLVWLKHGHKAIPEVVDPDGAYYPHVPLFAGLKVLETEGKKLGKFGPANGAVMEKLIEAGNLLARGRLEHSYPHSWRSKAPVIFRNTPQWFVRMDGEGEGGSLRDKALAAVDATTFHPAAGQARLRSMVETRPDWLISRQRAWGTPLAMFVDKQTGQPLADAGVNARIIKLIAEEGADAWYLRPASDFLGDLDPQAYEKVEDILDVWFDSGSTHVFTLEGREDSHWPADLYSEGSDQHRGWFQSSLLEACGTRGVAPFKAVVTHGFTLDEKGEKMSKSKGNTIEPQDIIKESGAEILRLWTALTDYVEDQRIGKTILAGVADAYRKLRNTLRYLLGALEGFDEAERLPLEQMPPLERYILHRLWELDGEVRAAYERYDYTDVVRPLLDFCQGDLSSLFFDIRRDSLYCDAPDDVTRRAYRTVLDAVFERLTAWLSPICSFTMDEAWVCRFPDAGFNALRVIPDTPAEWRNKDEAARWAQVKAVTEAVTAALETQRRDKRIGSALDAKVAVLLDREVLDMFEDDASAAEIFRTSSAVLLSRNGSEQDLDRWDAIDADEAEQGPGQDIWVRVKVQQAAEDGCKCARCWRILPEVKPATQLCLRCEDVVAARDSGAAA
ncbi:MAG: isoleucine--tRNA ligase [Caulobacter sp.]|nr:isoleucine--tRNA ligase [Caulobacter sp.]